MKDPKWQTCFGITCEGLKLHHKFLEQQHRFFYGYLQRNPLGRREVPSQDQVPVLNIIFDALREVH